MDLKSRRDTLRMFTNGVYVITSRTTNGYGGATVTWVSQASFRPPLIMAAIRKDSNVFRCLSESGLAAIHVLASTQRDVAQRFFTPTRVSDGQMNGEPLIGGKTSVPILQSAPAYVECQVRRILDDLGDHVIVILEVLEAECRQQTQPMTVAESPWRYGG
jgi:flavin reductase (DIM6/NTAB) family NADH-FMN oxidoreductase RutF